MTRALAFALALALAGAAPAAASGICDPENPEGDEIVEQLDAIIPCAMAENGFFGAACADAPVYVVTTTGVVLCQVSLAVVAPTGSTTEISARPVAPLGTTWSFTAPHALASFAARLPPPVIDDAPRSPVALRGPPADVPPDPFWGPS